MKESARITHGYKCSLLSLGLLLILINVLGFLAIVVCFLVDRVGNVASVRARPPPSRRENRCGDCGCQAFENAYEALFGRNQRPLFGLRRVRCIARIAINEGLRRPPCL